MKTIITLASLWVVLASISPAGELRASGACAITETALNIQLNGDDIHVVCELKSGAYFNDYALFAVPRITNVSNQPLTVSYQAAFFDEQGELIGAISERQDVYSDAVDVPFSKTVDVLSRDAIQKIRSYQIVIYTFSATGP